MLQNPTKYKISILGAGESGIGTALLAKAKGYEVFVSDGGEIKENYKKELEGANIEFEEGKHSAEKLLNTDEMMKSPGIPDSAEIVQLAKAEKLPIVSEIEFASRFTKARIIAITGTNGKTTTTLLINHLLKTAEFDVAMAGNIGESFARKLVERDYDYFVLEVSSFQLDDIQKLRPNIGILLNITPDHLDRYNYELDKYIDSKFQLVKNMQIGDVFIYNADDENIARKMNRTNISASTELFTEGFYQLDKLTLPSLGYINKEIDGEEVSIQASERLQFENLPLRGKHNGMNMSASILTALRLGVTKKQIEEGLKTFKNAPHRLEEVAKIHKVIFVHDSKATNVDATSYALDSFEKPIVWIVGGVDKGNEYEQIRELVERNVKAIICLGVDNQKLMKFFGERVSFIDETQDVYEAVSKAYHLAESKDIVLLSPACASFDLFRNYEDRGEQFKEAVQKLKKELE
jgi:UDP-N-acetylmuramoylalanine--D-glutamate ligase